MPSLFPALLYTLAIAATTVKASDAPAGSKPRRNLRGRFLHITDMHPDQHYLVGASMSSSCHRHRPRKQHVRAGYFGTPFRSAAQRNASEGLQCPRKNYIEFMLIISHRLWCSECDSPWTLTNLTLDYLEKEWADNIDFVVCTSPHVSTLSLFFSRTVDARLTRRRDGGQRKVSGVRSRNLSISGNRA